MRMGINGSARVSAVCSWIQFRIARKRWGSCVIFWKQTIVTVKHGSYKRMKIVCNKSCVHDVCRVPIEEVLEKKLQSKQYVFYNWILGSLLSSSDNGYDRLDFRPVFFSFDSPSPFQLCELHTVLFWRKNTETYLAEKNKYQATSVCTLLLLLSYQRRLFLIYNPTIFRDLSFSGPIN